MKAVEAIAKGDLLLNVFIGMFVMFMFLPLVLMMLAAFNSVSPPSVTDWQELTLAWFPRLLEEDRLIGCLQNSFRIVMFVVPASVLLGLSAAILLTRLEGRMANLLYAFLISPMLMPQWTQANCSENSMSSPSTGEMTTVPPAIFRALSVESARRLGSALSPITRRSSD